MHGLEDIIAMNNKRALEKAARRHIEHGPEDGPDFGHLLPKRPGGSVDMDALRHTMMANHSTTREALAKVEQKPDHGTHLPTDSAARKALPICTGVLDYFPDALAAVAEVSRIGNDQHNPGQPLHWSKGKSTDHADCVLRHMAERGTRDTDGGRHTAKAAWRVLAQLQMEIEAERAGLSFNDYIAKLNKETTL